ncbi:hypothetical protein FRC12_003330 [Ceratobasidium sp. 428]|nr:hypothetical protein FRC12_003330 [Ceratobasidium sp. 428]
MRPVRCKPTEAELDTDVRRVDDILQGYYLVVFALCRGSNNRSGLPLELVQYICQFAGFIDPRRLAVVIRQPTEFTPIKRLHRCFYMHIPRRLFSWLRLPVIPPHLSSLIESMEVTTYVSVLGRWYNTSPDRFIFRIVDGTDPDTFKTGADGLELTWPCFEGEHVEFHTCTEDPKRMHRAAKIGPRHEIWSHMGAGDRIEVAVVAYKWEFEHLAYDGHLEMNFWWRPSERMLRLV